MMTLLPDSKLNKMHKAARLLSRPQKRAIGAFLLHGHSLLASDEGKRTLIRDAIEFYQSD
jgi:hypothetical protein